VANTLLATPFVGRRLERTLLREALQGVRRGEGRVVLIDGDAGMGKSRLLEAAAADALGQEVAVLWGRCSEDGGAPPYWPWRQVLRGWLDAARTEALPGLRELLAAVAPACPEVLAACPEPPALPVLEPAQERFRLFDGVALLLRAAATEHPLCILLDDLHRADMASLQLLQFLLASIAESRIMLAGAYRGSELAPGHPLLHVIADLPRHSAGTVVRLGGLSETDVDTFTARLMPQPLSDRVRAELFQRSEGNPFFLSELARVLLDQGPVAGAGPLPVPATVRDTIRFRLGRLSAASNETLLHAAVLGRDFTIAALEAVGPLAGDALLTALEEAERAGIVAGAAGTPGRMRFAHVLIRDTIYYGTPAAQRARLHHAVGDALEGLWRLEVDAHLAELAAHFHHAGISAAAPRAVAYLRRAGDQAMQNLAYEEAAACYEQALQTLPATGTPTGRQRCERLLALGEALRQSGDFTAADTRFMEAAVRAREFRGAVEFAAAALGLTSGANMSFLDDARLALLQEAAAALPPEAASLRVRARARLARVQIFRPGWAQAETLSRDAVQEARQLGDAAALGIALDGLKLSLYPAPALAERLAIASEMLAIARRQNNAALEMQARSNYAEDLVAIGDIPAALAAVDEYTRRAEALRQPQYRWYARCVETASALFAGRFADAGRLMQEVSAIGTEISADAVITAAAHQIVLVRALGQQEAALAALGAMVARYPHLPIHLPIAVMHSDLGHETEARLSFEQLAADRFSSIARTPAACGSLAMAAEVCAFVGDRQRAEVLYEYLLPHGDSNALVGLSHAWLGSVQRYLALLAATLARWEAAEQHFEQALALNRRMGGRPGEAATLHDFAAMLIRRGRRDDQARARELAAAAQQIAAELGMARLAEQAAAVLAAAEGEQERARRPALPAGLSEREIEVLRLVAAGKSNREIGETLVLSINTVNRHVSHIFEKTGAQNRAEATAFALRHALA